MHAATDKFHEHRRHEHTNCTAAPAAAETISNPYNITTFES